MSYEITQECLSAYLIRLREEEKSPHTIQKYFRDVKAFGNFADGDFSGKETVLRWKERLNRNYKPRSVNSMLASLNHFFSFMGWERLRVRMFRIQEEIYEREERELTRMEYERLLRETRRRKNRRMEMLLQTLGATGIRISELPFITVETVRKGKADVRGKGKQRQVFLPGELCQALRRYGREQKITAGPLFVTRTGRPLDRSNIWREMKKLCERSGVSPQKVFPHNLRHLFAKIFYQLEKDIVKLADILGHSSINTTRIYTKESGKSHRRMIERMKLILYTT